MALSLDATVVDTGDDVTLSWARNDTSYAPCASGTDWVGFFCGDDVASLSDKSYLDYVCVVVVVVVAPSSASSPSSRVAITGRVVVVSLPFDTTTRSSLLGRRFVSSSSRPSPVQRRPS